MNKQQIQLNSTEFKPRSEYLLVKPKELESEKVLASGIIVPLTKKTITGDRPTTGEVISVGSEIEDIKEGDFVIWPETDGIDMEFNDGEFLLLRDKSIIGVKK